ncbi:hypothetical protein L3X38_039307 [Prunus dulcis]|uniref:Uncharacterized protein n=1 Tax=Prunus dulcis TaxID=3755 RepID=A0AAD4YSG2_PRUDU|nr:hypothetical protein L3X38_039307 [Prunus dulcis]
MHLLKFAYPTGLLFVKSAHCLMRLIRSCIPSQVHTIQFLWESERRKPHPEEIAEERRNTCSAPYIGEKVQLQSIKNIVDSYVSEYHSQLTV